VIINKDGKDLDAIGFGFAELFALKLDDQSELRIDNVLRIMPGRRLVASGTWQNKHVVAKMFFDKKHAKRHLSEELAGIKLLQDRNIPAPRLLQQLKSHDNHAEILIFEFLRADIDLSNAWQQPDIRDDLMPLLKMLMVEMATQHVFGLVQKDLHPNNFLISNNIIYTLDCAQIEWQEGILPKKPSMQNLALFLSQLGVGAEKYQTELFQHYVKARGWVWKEADLRELFYLIDIWMAERWKRFERKIFRNSTHFRRINHWKCEAVYDRDYDQPELTQFLQHPETVFSDADAVMLKEGRSSTVIRLSLDGRDVVIKRYNMKSVWHWLRRCLRSTRAKKCWRIAQKLRLFGVNTARPIAYLETKFLGLSGKSYFVTECIAGENVGDYLRQHQKNDVKQKQMIEKICTLFANLKKMAITHGDLKATNLLVDNGEQPVLIDLDGAHEHRVLTTLNRTSLKEWQRFLRNFDDVTFIKKKFENVYRNKIVSTGQSEPRVSASGTAP